MRTVALRCVEDVLLGARRSGHVIARALATLVFTQEVLPLARSQVTHTKNTNILFRTPDNIILFAYSTPFRTFYNTPFHTL